MRVLVGFDGSEGAWDAVAFARRIESFVHGEILLVGVTPPGQPPKDAFQEPLQALAGADVETRSLSGDSPARAIRALADEEDADLVLVGSPHRGVIGRALAGSVAESLLHGRSRPLVVAPRGYASSDRGEVTLVAAAYDGTAEAKLALGHAAAVATAAGARLRILTVVAPAVPMPSGAGYAPVVGFDPEAMIAEALAAVGPGVQAEGVRLAGAPAAALAEACEDGVDLLVAGTRGYGALGRVFTGSVCAKLIRGAPCPVLVVPPPVERDVEGETTPERARRPRASEQAGQR